MTSGPDGAWRPTAAVLTAVVTSVSCLVLAVVLRRPDLVVVAAPLLVGTVAALSARPAGTVSVRLGAPRSALREDEVLRVVGRLAVDGDVDAAVVRTAAPGGVELDPHQLVQVVRPAPGEQLDVAVDGWATRWGRWPIGPMTVTLLAAHGLLRREVTSGTALVSVVPLRAAFDATDALPYAAGLAGPHRSHRPGDGSDLVSLRPFVAGDRLRRITWPASLRTGQLHVRATTDDRDADIELVLDTWAEVGTPGSAVGTSLDASVRAAASIAEHYLRQGDRVGLVDVGRPARPIRAAAGRRHLSTVLDALMSARVRQPDADVTTRALGRLRPRSLVIVVTTLLADPIGHHIAALAQSGRAVLVVDTLPADVAIPTASEWTPLAWRLAMLRRATLIETLGERGVPVAAWRGGGRSLDAVLRLLSVAARAARRGR